MKFTLILVSAALAVPAGFDQGKTMRHERTLHSSSSAH